MLVALAVGIVGVFTALVWLLSAALGLRHAAHVVVAQPATEAAGTSPDVRVAIAATRPGALPSH
jgi:disulfide bond formation protein DsbB